MKADFVDKDHVAVAVGLATNLTARLRRQYSFHYSEEAIAGNAVRAQRHGLCHASSSREMSQCLKPAQPA